MTVETGTLGERTTTTQLFAAVNWVHTLRVKLVDATGLGITDETLDKLSSGFAKISDRVVRVQTVLPRDNSEVLASYMPKMAEFGGYLDGLTSLQAKLIELAEVVSRVLRLSKRETALVKKTRFLEMRGEEGRHAVADLNARLELEYAEIDSAIDNLEILLNMLTEVKEIVKTKVNNTTRATQDLKAMGKFLRPDVGGTMTGLPGPEGGSGYPSY